MNELGEGVWEIIVKETETNPEDIGEAVNAALRRIRRLRDYEEIVERLLRKAVTEAVYDARHVANVRMKRQAGYYAEKNQGKQGSSDGVEQVYRSIYDYRIASTTLGSLVGSQLLGIADSETQIGNGHMFNAALCRWIHSQGVGDDQTVAEVIPEKKLRAAFARLARLEAKVQRSAARVT